jgi:hypothetical protein
LENVKKRETAVSETDIEECEGHYLRFDGKVQTELMLPATRITRRLVAAKRNKIDGRWCRADRKQWMMIPWTAFTQNTDAYQVNNSTAMTPGRERFQRRGRTAIQIRRAA